MQSYVGPASLLSLFLGAIRLDRETYERAAAEPRATHQCLAMTALAAVCQAAYVAHQTGDPWPLVAMIGMALALLGLLGRAIALWLIGKLGGARGRITIGSAIRPLSLAAAPGVLFVIGAFLDAAGPRGREIAVGVLDPGVGAWLLVASVVAMRVALRRGWLVAILMALAFRLVEAIVNYVVRAA